MKLSQTEWDILKIYISADKESTTHNLIVASLCFEPLPQAKAYVELSNKIKAMTLFEFLKYRDAIVGISEFAPYQ